MNTKYTVGDVVEVMRRGEKMNGKITGVFVYPSGTSDYSIGCAAIQPFWIHESYIKSVKAV